ncbi:NAD(P)/FAD-dependent oxidoreductase [Hymenobacter sp. J193]|uniref:NAD(P)/FAD-dependent oxidoreductase n=1 Tax=Hymenobacter sp. J193 TaxID=2898429 RepID=UPI0021517884|nr:NAD(P)/FAD-dependent oxidoreductase [Hymenobacter sp. J193]MCR5888168.1 NAD(P)/FAD-dependent oxidoreductase [Hymenobacter sp. J193]
MPRIRPTRRRHLPATDFDAVIVGGGSAGLSAALTLGRCCRRVLVCSSGPPRNAPSPGVHSFFTRDGTKPAELLRLGREELAAYPTVSFREALVTAIVWEPEEQYFTLTMTPDRGGPPLTSTTRKVLLATGVADDLPPIDGMRELWGRGVLHCPYCHGWEVQGQRLAVYGRGKTGWGLVQLVSRWSRDVVLCTDGPSGITEHGRQRLRRLGITVREEKIVRLEGRRDGQLRHIVFASGEPLERDAVFLHAEQRQRSLLAQETNCRILKSGAVWTDKRGQTSQKGIYAAGDTTPAPQQAIIAAAEGSLAAIALNEALTREDCRG